MPIYEYVCEDCKKPFEKLVMNQSEQIVCPQCGGRHHKLQFSVIAAPSRSGAEKSAATGTSCACTPSSCGCH
ncbi:MAG TPA: zinc ribbon domain-containing protein [Terriglobia bacterium]|nr:zinc ribbon domain-containing protein [Terriglobia bacterium]